MQNKSNIKLSGKALGMNILIIGFGSVGQRHYNNLLKLGFKNIYVYDIDKTKTQTLPPRTKVTGLKNLTRFDVAFICNPNHLHVRAAIKCARAGCHLFIEKPLSHNLKGIKKLEQLCKEKKLVNMVACNLRFHPCLRFVKNYLNKNKLGKIYSISHEYGYFLPYWRPGQDYRKNYAAKKSTGGGIILDDIHEFDLLFWLNNFEKAKEAKFVFDKVSDLKIETEDLCLASFKFTNKVLGFVKCDYLQQRESRNLKIVGEKGNLEIDLVAEAVYFKDRKSDQKLFKINRDNDNDDFISEERYFLNCVFKKIKTFNGVSMAAGLLKNILIQMK